MLASAAFGFLKGALRPAPPYKLSDVVGFGLLGPAVEEMTFRAPLLLRRAPPGLTAVAFAAAHVDAEAGMHTARSGAFRFAEVALGGLLYEQALKRWGIFGAVAAHASHNIAVALGNWVRFRSSGPGLAVDRR